MFDTYFIVKVFYEVIHFFVALLPRLFSINYIIVFQCPVKFVRSIGSIQYCIKRHVASLENCFSCKVPKEYVTNNNSFLSQF